MPDAEASSFRPRAAAAPEREQRENEHGHGVADDSQADAQGNPLVPIAEDNERAADEGRQGGLGEEAKEKERWRRLFESLDKPRAVIVFPAGAHEPGELEIARGDQDARGGNDHR